MKSRECAENLAEPAQVSGGLQNAAVPPQIHYIEYRAHIGYLKKTSKKVKKGIDNTGRIWYSNKAVGAVVSCAGEK